MNFTDIQLALKLWHFEFFSNKSIASIVVCNCIQQNCPRVSWTEMTANSPNVTVAF